MKQTTESGKDTVIHRFCSALHYKVVATSCLMLQVDSILLEANLALKTKRTALKSQYWTHFDLIMCSSSSFEVFYLCFLQMVWFMILFLANQIAILLSGICHGHKYILNDFLTQIKVQRQEMLPLLARLFKTWHDVLPLFNQVQ